jgi:osmotically-inducible protein OsmY
MDDKALRQTVSDALDLEPDIDAAHIGVAVTDGVVTLSGHAKSYDEKIAAEEAAKRVRGVRAIAQEIEVRYPSAKKTHDDEIARRALDILAWQAQPPKGRLEVTVEGGWVTLDGMVNTVAQHRAAETAVRKLSGVMGIVNRLSVALSPDIPLRDIKAKVLAALARNSEIAARPVAVSLEEDGTVILEGSVHDWYERMLVEDAARTVPGVRAVKERLAISR